LDDRQFELGIGPGQLQFVGPGAFKGFLPEDFEGADDLGAGLPGDLLVGFEMDAILAKLLGRDELGGLAVKLAQLAQAGVVGLFGAGAMGRSLRSSAKDFRMACGELLLYAWTVRV
jgi:hypothetical protein